MIRVVNKKDHKPTSDDVYIGRPSILGNPFTHLKQSRAQYIVASRDEACNKYREWLRDKIVQGDDLIIGELARIRKLSTIGDVNLVCWCAPLTCHGDYLKEILEDMNPILSAGEVGPEE